MTDTVTVDAAEFPLAVALRSTGGPERRTEIVALGSGREVRNARWAGSRRRWDAGSGVHSLMTTDWLSVADPKTAGLVVGGLGVANTVLRFLTDGPVGGGERG